MATETPSPPPERSARRPISENGPDRGRGTQPAAHSSRDRGASRELSPWSARRALTLATEGKDTRPRPRRSRSRSRTRGDKTQHRGRSTAEERPRASQQRSRSRPREKKPRQTSRERNSKAKDPSPASRARPGRSGSPEPYRQSREGSIERRRDRSRDGKRDRSRERHRDRSRDRRRNRSKDRKHDRSRDRKHRDRSRSPIPYRPSHKRRERSSRSPSPHKRRKRSPSSSPPPRSRKPLESQEVSFRGLDNSAQPPSKYGGAPPEREKPNFKPTGLLAKDANKVEGTKISLKYHEPPEARKPPPSSQWRLFIFKGADTLGTIELFTQSCWLLGRAAEVADVLLEHPSISQQHAAIQFRYIQKTVEDEYGVRKKTGKVKPYVIDLESSNGTEVNGEEIEAGRYYEIRDKDVLRFGGSEREYVVMLPPKE